MGSREQSLNYHSSKNYLNLGHEEIDIRDRETYTQFILPKHAQLNALRAVGVLSDRVYYKMVMNLYLPQSVSVLNTSTSTTSLTKTGSKKTHFNTCWVTISKKYMSHKNSTKGAHSGCSSMHEANIIPLPHINEIPPINNKYCPRGQIPIYVKVTNTVEKKVVYDINITEKEQYISNSESSCTGEETSHKKNLKEISYDNESPKYNIYSESNSEPVFGSIIDNGLGCFSGSATSVKSYYSAPPHLHYLCQEDYKLKIINDFGNNLTCDSPSCTNIDYESDASFYSCSTNGTNKDNKNEEQDIEQEINVCKTPKTKTCIDNQYDEVRKSGSSSSISSNESNVNTSLRKFFKTKPADYRKYFRKDPFFRSQKY